MLPALRTRGTTAGSRACRCFHGKQQDDATVGRGGYDGSDDRGDNSNDDAGGDGVNGDDDNNGVDDKEETVTSVVGREEATTMSTVTR